MEGKFAPVLFVGHSSSSETHRHPIYRRLGEGGRKGGKEEGREGGRGREDGGREGEGGRREGGREKGKGEIKGQSRRIVGHRSISEQKAIKSLFARTITNCTVT